MVKGSENNAFLFLMLSVYIEYLSFVPVHVLHCFGTTYWFGLKVMFDVTTYDAASSHLECTEMCKKEHGLTICVFYPR